VTIKISVVTPSYNHAEYIEETFKSVFNQGYPSLEYIVMDGGSTDGTPAILDKYRDKFDYCVSQKDNGQTDALIQGFNRATGDILCWLNSDDLFEPYTLWEVAAYFAANPRSRFVYGDALWINRQGRVIRPKKEIPYNPFIWFHTYGYIPQPSAFWRRDLYEEVGGLDPRWQLAMDADLWLRFAEKTKPQHVRRVWSRMRDYPEQKNQKFRAKSEEEGTEIALRYVKRLDGTAFRARQLVAKAMRVGWKAALGAYW
jgi:glycosyltransferase involved in cell wall biosynthesis